MTETLPGLRDPSFIVMAAGSGLMILGAILVPLALVLGVAGGIYPDREVRSMMVIGWILIAVGNPLFLLGIHQDYRQRARRRAELLARMWGAERGRQNP
jgi:hypothetical protein